jgi:DNA-binding response OmpR family regulator
MMFIQTKDAETHGRVLVIDDTESARVTLDALLRHEGYELLEASSGEAGLELAAREHPDAIVLDVMMPGMDGFTVCERLRANPDLAHIPVLMVTALAESQSRRRAIEVGADDIIAKPFERWELRARLGTLVRLGRAQRGVRERERLLWIIDRARTGFALLDANGTVRHANRKFRELLGLGQERSLAVPFDLLVQTHNVRVHDSTGEALGDWDPRTGPFGVGSINAPVNESFELWVHGGASAADWRIVELRTLRVTPPSVANITP